MEKPGWIPDIRTGKGLIARIPRGLHAAAMASPRLTTGRHSQTGAAYAVTFVASGRSPILVDAVVARQVAIQFQRCDEEGMSLTHAWVVMPDHVHWLFGLRGSNLSTCVGRCKSRAARAVNRQRDMCGAVWQAGFFDHRVRGEKDLRAQARYLIWNPVRAGLVAHPNDYPHWGCRWLPRSGSDLL